MRSIEVMLTDVLLSMEGGFSDKEKDKGGATIYGISSKAFPDAFEKAKSGEWGQDDVREFYKDQFMSKIARWDSLVEAYPEIAALLFWGKVHGIGDEDYTTVIQQVLRSSGAEISVDGIWGPNTADALLRAESAVVRQVIARIRSVSKELVSSRQKAVGAFPTGIRNRVLREIRAATELANARSDESSPEWATVLHNGERIGLRLT